MQLANNNVISYWKTSQPEIQLAILLFIAGFGLELWALHLLLNNMLLKALIIHVFAALHTPWPLCKFMPKHFRINYGVLLLLFTLCLFIPLVSGICLLISFSLGLYNPKSINKKFLKVNNLPTPPGEGTANTLSFSPFSSGLIIGTLKFSQDEDKRIKAVLATRQMENQTSIPLLRIALLDSSDEVRLLAFSMLDNKQKKIDTIIHRELMKLRSSKLQPDEKKSIHQTLAEAFWELSYSTLAEGRVRVHTLNSAKQHVIEALKIQNNEAGLHLLHARIAILLNSYEEASNALTLANTYGVSNIKIASYRAEIAFELKQFNEVSQHIQIIDKLAQNNMILNGIVRQWI
ncbi:MAG: hypothetical protein KAH20_10570 [Methylococcales bacterium]|nr:hypothetical protein [Methylococcales bacterium]